MMIATYGQVVDLANWYSQQYIDVAVVLTTSQMLVDRSLPLTLSWWQMLKQYFNHARRRISSPKYAFILAGLQQKHTDNRL